MKRAAEITFCALPTLILAFVLGRFVFYDSARAIINEPAGFPLKCIIWAFWGYGLVAAGMFLFCLFTIMMVDYSHEEFPGSRQFADVLLSALCAVYWLVTVLLAAKEWKERRRKSRAGCGGLPGGERSVVWQNRKNRTGETT
jgi:hypothetical protein